MDRYNYFADSHQIVLRMPTNTHETFLHAVVVDISTQLRALAEVQEPEPAAVAAFPRDVRPSGAPTMRLLTRATMEAEDSEASNHPRPETYINLTAASSSYSRLVPAW
jgi:hypothetical protein